MIRELHPPKRLLLGPGPSMVHQRVLQALATPLIGHLDPAFLAIMNDIQARLRHVFSTSNRFTIALSGTGSAGMEAPIVNVVEPGDVVIVGVNGVFGTQLATVIERCGGKAVRVEAPWGQIIPPDMIEAALRRTGPVKAVALVHAETSTGAWQPIEPVGRLCRDHDTLLIVDAVTSLGGVPVEVDQWGIDVCYSGTQKCLSCPPGLAPLTVSARAIAIHPLTDAYFNRALAFYRRVQFDKAIEDLTRAISKDSDNAEFYHNRALALYRKGEYDRAIEDETAALSLSPKYAEAFHNRGVAYARREEYDKAIEDYNAALSLRPGYADALFSRGVALTRKATIDFWKACQVGLKLACENMKQLAE